jgi:hypothetical protein
MCYASYPRYDCGFFADDEQAKCKDIFDQESSRVAEAPTYARLRAKQEAPHVSASA